MNVCILVDAMCGVLGREDIRMGGDNFGGFKVRVETGNLLREGYITSVKVLTKVDVQMCV